MLKITSKDSIDAMKKLYIVNDDVRVNDEVQNKIARNTTENLNVDDRIFENVIINNNLLNFETQNIHTTVKFNIRCSNRLIEIENSLSNADRRTSTTTFATINKISIEKKTKYDEDREFRDLHK